jgi:2-polyprenyl-3-methyl-5-hydroxy-6-metoxy-1,4-benzoquinol methylase
MPHPFANNEGYDFVCSSHVIEHMANPLKALHEWMRVIKPGGIIYIGVPDKRHTFDHRRQRTSLAHLIDDYNKDVDQTDPTHVTEFMENWDESRDSCCNREQFLQHLRNNPLSSVHHHVWITEDVREIFEYVGLKVVYGPVLRGDTIHIIGMKEVA